MEDKLNKEQMKTIFKELMLYYPNNPYKEYNSSDISIIIKMYYSVLKSYDEKHIRRRMMKHIESNKFFPQVCDLIPKESDFKEML